MKILCVIRPCASYYIRTGWKNAFEALGHQFVFWNPEQENPFSAFERVQPDIFIGETFTLNRALVKCLKRFPKTRVCMVASNFGSSNEDVIKTHPYVLMANAEEVDLVKEVRPEFVFAHYPDHYIKETLGLWEKAGTIPRSMLSAADTFVYCGGEKKKNLECDIGYVGGNWGVKSLTLSKFLGPLCHPLGKYNIKVFGNQPHSVPQYLGLIDDKDVRDLFQSAKILPNVHEEHSQVYGFDVIERPFKVLAAGGGLLVSDYVEGLECIFHEREIMMAKTPDQFAAIIDYYLTHDKEREELVRIGQTAVLENHTYLHRAIDFFRYFGMEEEVENGERKLYEMLSDRGE